MAEGRALASDVQWFPHRLDLAAGAIHFVKLTRDDHRTASFLADEYVGEGGGRKTAPIGTIAAAAGAAPPGHCHFIFHSSFCCSTLLARALDIEGKVMNLKEPPALTDLAKAAPASRQPLGLLLALLARPFAPGEAVIVKPSNVANPIIGDMLALRPEARALLLHAPLADYLASIAKKGLFGRVWVRRLLASLMRRPEFDAGFTEAQSWEHSDLQVAALAWLQQQAQFARLVREQPPGRIATLDSATLLADPGAAMEAVGAHFGLGLSTEEAATIAAGPIFASDSKRHGKAFDATARAEERTRAEAAYGEEIAMVLKWAEAVADHVGVPMRLEAALLG